MAYRISGCGITAAALDLEAARGFVEDQLARHPEVIAAPFGGSPGVTWTWNLDDLEARNGDTGAVLFTIRAVPDL